MIPQSNQVPAQFVRIDLSGTNLNKPFEISGEWFFVYRAAAKPDNSAAISFNAPWLDGTVKLPLIKGQKWRWPFRRFFVTNTGVAGAYVDVIIGQDKLTDASYIDVGEISTLVNGWDRSGGIWALIDARTIADGMQFDAPQGALETVGVSMLYKPGGNNYERPRTPDVWKTARTVIAGAGQTTIWTPAAGKKFRLMAFYFSGTNNSGSHYLRDGVGGTDFLNLTHNGGAAATQPVPFPLPQNGYLSAAVNNVLQINAAGAITYDWTAVGTEE